MNLKLQILALLFSFIYGGIIGIFSNINYKLLFCEKTIFRLLGNFFFFLDMALLYFIVLKFINHAILHTYFLIMTILGFYIAYKYTKILRGKENVK